MHMAGLKNFARICDEMKNEDPNKEFPILSQMSKEQMKSYKPLEDGSGVVDPYMIVMNKAHDGYRRPYRREVANRLIKKKVGGGDASYMILAGLME
uniref:Uncharacterized protein n=1 Tax=Lactuca sativa TaxID=4236 RepID=A0A9R1V3G9_LACSA|nr:hypothetical protein LSAT_V11C600306600 [Lactuca sativa]